MSGISTSIELHDRMSGALNRITASLYNTTEAFYDIDRASQGAFDSSAIQAITQEMYGYEQRIQSLESDLARANDRIEEMENATRQAVQAADTLRSAFGVVRNVIAAIGVQKVLETSDELVQINSRINMMNDGLQSTQELTSMVYEAAQNARGSYTGMADVVARFGNNAKDAFSNSAEVVAFAELVQKQMTIAGASTTEASNAMLQLSQGLGSGALRGDELNSIFEQSPNLIRNIASYIERNEEVAKHMAGVLEVSYEEMSSNAMGYIRDLAAEGQLSADLVKTAIFSASDEINKKFNEMPMTWGQIWQSMQNTALVKFQPVLQRLNDIANSEAFQRFVNYAISGMTYLANVTLSVFEFMGAGASFVADNWSVIGPIVYGVAAALAVYGAYLAITKGLELASAAATTVMTGARLLGAAAMTLFTGATWSASTAQMGLNSAMYACPIVWIIILVIALIAAIVALCNWIAETTGIAQSSIGVICGAVAVAGAFIYNTVIGLINGIISLGISLYNLISNFASGLLLMFSNPLDGIKVMFLSVFDFIVGIVEAAAELLDAVFGSSLADSVSGFRDTIQAEIDTTLEANGLESHQLDASDYMLDRMEYGTAFSAGAEFGDNISDKFSNMFNGSALDLELGAGTDSAITSMGTDLSGINGNTAAVADSVDVSNENLAYMRDLAEQEAINRFTTASVRVEMGGVTNNVSSNTDLDGLVSYLSDGVGEALQTTAEGVHV